MNVYFPPQVIDQSGWATPPGKKFCLQGYGVGTNPTLATDLDVDDAVPGRPSHRFVLDIAPPHGG